MKAFSDRIKEELQPVRPSDDLVAETMRKMHAENADVGRKFQADVAKQATLKRSGFWKTRAQRIYACAAALALLLGGAALLANQPFVPVARLETDLSFPSQRATQKAGLHPDIEVLSYEEFSARAGLPLFTMIPGYSCIGSACEAYLDSSGTIVGDYGVFTYQRGAARLTLYASTTDETTPPELAQAEAVAVGAGEVRFGSVGDGAPFYAAWVSNGVSICVKCDGLGRGAFIRLIRSVVE